MIVAHVSVIPLCGEFGILDFGGKSVDVCLQLLASCAILPLGSAQLVKLLGGLAQGSTKGTQRTFLLRLCLDFVSGLLLKQPSLIFENLGLYAQFNIALRQHLILGGEFHYITSAFLNLCVVLLDLSSIRLHLVGVLGDCVVEVDDAVDRSICLQLNCQYLGGHVSHCVLSPYILTKVSLYCSPLSVAMLSITKVVASWLM